MTLKAVSAGYQVICLITEPWFSGSVFYDGAAGISGSRVGSGVVVLVLVIVMIVVMMLEDVLLLIMVVMVAILLLITRVVAMAAVVGTMRWL